MPRVKYIYDARGGKSRGRRTIARRKLYARGAIEFVGAKFISDR
jgi:hypothetical protein